ncbi:MAG: glycosyltransferase family 4 protein [Ignavibacteriaceae bacterium]|nr:glycosyltransferase family 4 protein [Ignavibacteriaceae bacterium]
MKNILHITPNFNYSCGRSKLAFLYLKYFGGIDNYKTHFITNGGDALSRLNEIPNLHFERFDFSTGFRNLIYKSYLYRSLKQYVLNNEIGLIHTHHRFAEFIATKIGTELNIKTITSAHSFVKGFERTSFKSHKIISVSKSLSNYLVIKYCVNKEKLITLYNPIEQPTQIDSETTDRFKLENSFSPDNKVLLFVGRIGKDKGYDTLISSLAYVTRKNKNVILVINGHTKEKVFSHKSTSNNDNIVFIPPQKDNNYLYLLADIVVLPSRVDPFPFVMIEAGSYKKPFIGGNTGGIAEFIEDGINGLLVDPENPQVLAEKIIYLLNNPQIGRTMGEKLYEKVNRLCDYNNYFNEVEKIYNSLLNRE